MPDVDKTSQPDYKSSAYSEMSEAWAIVRDVAGGTATMRAAGETYLPKEPAEKPENYARRLNRSVFFNAYRRTREALVGLVFKKDPVLEDDVPAEIKNHLENVDLAGTHFDVFSKEVFTDAFEGHSFILVDMQPKLEGNVTLADEKAAGRRPFWVRYKASQAVNWRTTQINGETILQQITFEECTCEPDGQYGEKDVVRYRVFWLTADVVRWELFRKVMEGEKVAFISEGTGTLTLKRIPVAVVYGRQKALYVSEPPLIDLAFLNIAHYQEYSDYRNILHVANVPILVRKGCPTDKQNMDVGPNSLADIPTDGDLFYCEHEGKAIGAARTELVDIEQRMAMAGLSIMAQRSDSTLTATEIRRNSVERTSELSTMARSLQDALELALGFHAEYMGLPSGGSVSLGMVEDLVFDAQTLATLLTAVTTGKLSLQTWLDVLAMRFPDVDFSEEAAKINTGNVGQEALASATAPIKSLYLPKAQPNGQGAAA